ncbi:hypothetical protein [Micromonospora inositola]|uniref:hypothetical protein n=1 Tax=Micromonospora inositola TaxID=47865 RepID=UPI0012FE5587|nr:hypothetical protein [Micromonospora inositola]
MVLLSAQVKAYPQQNMGSGSRNQHLTQRRFQSRGRERPETPCPARGSPDFPSPSPLFQQLDQVAFEHQCGLTDLLRLEGEATDPHIA